MRNRIFISYRREDSAAWAGRLYDQLAAHFGPDNIFMDVDDIDPGLDFVETIENTISQTNFLIVIIGPAWLKITDDEGNRRLEHPEDFVRIEISTALKRNIRVIPALIGRAKMPPSNDLPDDLKLLVRRNAININHTSFKSDAKRLIRVLERAITQTDAGSTAEEKESDAISGDRTHTSEDQTARKSTPKTPVKKKKRVAQPNEPGMKRSMQGIAVAAIVVTVLSVVGILFFSSQKFKQGSSIADKPQSILPGNVQQVVSENRESNIEVLSKQSEQSKQGDTMTEKTTGIQLVFIPGGCFLMGSLNEQPDKQPVHEICLDNYWIGKTEVTQRQWLNIMDGRNPARFQKGDDYPVESVSWYDVEEFISKLNKKSGKQFRMPTEAEWEYGCRAKGKGSYCGGDNIDDLAWYYTNSDKTTHPVSKKRANDFGLFDMSGNVWEWCRDWYGDDYYRNSPRNNPQGPSSGSVRVIRGGSWINGNARYLYSTFRNSSTPDSRDYYLGFRIVLPPGQ